jgi:hypothetical protein
MANDQSFNKIPFEQLDATTRRIIEANAAGSTVFNPETKKFERPTSAQYYESRGGVNKAGYYGDSYTPGKTLTDKEYFDTLNAARAAGGRGTDLGGAINAASAAKAAQYSQNNQTSQTSQSTVQTSSQSPNSGGGNNPQPSPSPIPLTPSTLSSTPSNISPVTQAPPPPPVKTAPIDTILFDEDAVPIQIMSDLIFENIGGQELINVARNDTVNGQQIIYQPIKNLTQIQQQYNPNNIVSLQATSDKYFQNFSIRFDNKVPTQGTGPDGSHVYIDPQTGELIVEAVNLDQDEQIEVEITTGGTIYEAEL